MPNDVISLHTVQCLWRIGVTWDYNKVLFFYISDLIFDMVCVCVSLPPTQPPPSLRSFIRVVFS